MDRAMMDAMEIESPLSKRADRRQVCPHCFKSLSYSAYWSHKAKYYDQETEEWMTVTSSQLPCEQLESSFDLSQDPDNLDDDAPTIESREYECPSNTSDQNWSDVELFSTDSDSESGGETGHVSSSVESDNDEMHEKVSQLVQFASLFLLKLQLLYKLSDSVITMLLKFFRILFSFLSNLLPNAPLTLLANSFPSSLYLTRKCAQLRKDRYTAYGGGQPLFTFFFF
jgi:hypothetical protein